MNIELTSGKDVLVTDMLRERVEQKLAKVESRLGQQLFFRVRFEREGADVVSCHIHFRSTRNEFDAKASEDEVVKAADSAVAKIERQLKKLQDKQSARGGLTIRETVDLEEPAGEGAEGSDL
ncbi:MAG: ribosome-associated translation inhibitor RaiA [Deltaproteobacteria bacterium]|nr:ribosome-associated translation inhibitor RaiA [Deltaproteobacteria bacterium]